MGENQSAVSEPSPLLGGRHRLVSLVAKGAMGEVHVALDETHDQRVALKRMRPAALQDKGALEAFRAEYRLLRALQHPRIIEVYSYGLDGELPYYTMELLDGADLRTLAPLPPQEACRCLRDVASSIALLHARGLLHRDLSPRNVRRTSDGRCKLIDFGTMIPLGMPPNVAGTPPLLAPEAMQRVPLDARADLYSLGALGYWLLTGKHAYDVRELRDLPEAWKSPPPTTRRFNDAIAPALDGLIFSLLDHNPDARPSSAAEVVDRLTAVGNLAPDTSPEIAASYLARTAMVGREREREWLDSRIAKTAAGQGGAVRIHARAGLGKSRLLQDARVSAETHGLLVVAANARQVTSDGGLALALGRALLPQVAGLSLQWTAAAMDALDSLARPTHARQSVVGPSGGSRALDAVGSRAHLQSVLGVWFTEVARVRPMLVAVDDLARTDEFSGAFVAALAAETQRVPLLVLASHDVDNDEAGSPAFSTFCKLAHRISLAALDAEQTQRLVASSFGAVSHIDHVATWVFRNANGDPAMSIELMRHLADRQVVRFVAGAWVLPDLPIEEEAPQELRRALALRLARLAPDARLLVELLAVHGGSAPQEVLEAASGLSTATGVVLDALLAQDVLERAGEHVSFKLASMGAAIEHGLEPARVRDLHGQLAEALLADESGDDGRLLAAGWHLSHTSDELRGARILASVGPRLLQTGVTADTAAAAMERALEIYERHDEPDAHRLRLRAHLTYAGYICDERLAHRYGREAVEDLYHASGTARAARWARVLGPTSAVLASLAWTSLTNLFVPRRRRPPNVGRCLRYFLRAATSLSGVGAINLDRSLTAWVAQRTHVLARAQIPDATVAALTCVAFELQPLGCPAALRHALTRALAAFRTMKKWTRLRGGSMPVGMDNLHAGLRLAQGINQCFRVGPDALTFANALQAEGTPLAETFAERVRMVYHAMRGHREEAERSRHIIELRGIQGGSTWQVSAFSLPIEGMAAAVHGDVVMCRRALEQLEQSVRTTPGLVPHRDMVRVGYHFARCEYARAVELGEIYVAENPPGSVIGWSACYGAIAQSMFELGEYQRCLEFSQKALAEVGDDDLDFVILYASLEGARAMALAMLGQTDLAAEYANGLVSRLRQGGEHTHLAMVFDYQARVARRRGDMVAMTKALIAMSAAARASGNPAFIAGVERTAGIRRRMTTRTSLSDSGPPRASTLAPAGSAGNDRGRGQPGEETDDEGAGTGDELVTQVLQDLRDPAAQARQALRILAQSVGARDGFLFVPSSAGPRLAARLIGRPPAADVEAAAKAELERTDGWEQRRVLVYADAGLGDTAGVDDRDRSRASTFLIVALGEEVGRRVAVAALEVEPGELARLSPQVIKQTGTALA